MEGNHKGKTLWLTLKSNLSKRNTCLQFETLGDAMYMTVSGAPVKKLRHAEPMSAMALDTIEAVKSIKNPANRKPMTVTIGKRFSF